MQVLREAFAGSFCVSAEAAAAWLVVSALAKHAGIGRTRWLFALCLLAGGAVGVILVVFRASPLSRALLPWLESSRILLALFIVTGGVVSRMNFAPVDTRGNGGAVRLALLWLLPCAGLLWVVYESAVLASTLGGLALLTERKAAIILAAVLGLGAAAAACAAAEFAAARLKPSPSVTPPSLFFLLFALKMVGAATWGTNARPAAMWFVYFIDNTIHDTFHILFVMFQFPDHPFLKDAVYQGILYFFKPMVHAVTAAATLTLLIAVAWFFFLRRPATAIPAETRPPGVRLIKASTRGANFRVSATFIAAAAMVWAGIMYAQSRSDALYDPVPIPVVSDARGMVTVPLAGQFELAAESRLRKYVYSDATHAIKFLTIKRPDGTFAATLDMCEVCQPKGYAQLDEQHLLCIYCKTPIPLATVGTPGGCNPIPIPGAEVDGLVMRLPRDLLIETYDKAMERKK